MTAITVAVVVGVFDFLTKGTANWSDLPGLFRGWSWHLSMGTLFFAMLLLIALAHRDFKYLYFVTAYIAEDATYYLMESVASRRLLWNNWLGLWSSKRQYWLTVLIVLTLNIGGAYVA